MGAYDYTPPWDSCVRSRDRTVQSGLNMNQWNSLLTRSVQHPCISTPSHHDLIHKCIALEERAVILALGMIIKNKNGELLSTFEGRIQNLEKVNARNKRISTHEHEL